MKLTLKLQRVTRPALISKMHYYLPNKIHLKLLFPIVTIVFRMTCSNSKQIAWIYFDPPICSWCYKVVVCAFMIIWEGSGEFATPCYQQPQITKDRKGCIFFVVLQNRYYMHEYFLRLELKVWRVSSSRYTVFLQD